jgi:ubiquinone/menaquinone biosynthesis C-methylase UbiE
MPDVWASVTELDRATQERLADVLEARGSDPQQQALRASFLEGIAFPARSRVLEVGCGTGVLTRKLSSVPNVDSVTGIDPAPSLLAKARELSKHLPNVSFQEADGRSLPFEAGSFDVVLFDSTVSHVPEPDRALAEAFRVLRPSGWLALFDGDYATTTVAVRDNDPLQACVDAMMANSVNDRRVMRRVSALAQACGFKAIQLRSHGFVDTGGGAYMLSVIERGADMLGASGTIGEGLVAALKAEARSRVEQGTFFGHIAYGSLTARKPS